MKFTLPDGVFPPLKLSKKRQDALANEAEAVVSDTIAANEAFLADGTKFRTPKWRLVRVKEGLHVCRQRPTARNAKAEEPEIHRATWSTDRSRLRDRTRSRNRGGIEDSLPSTASLVSDGTIMEKMRRPSVSLMALHGTVDGALEDTIFGAFAPTDQTWKWRSSHVNDRLDDARLLATIKGPSRQNPLGFLAIKWFAKEHPAVLTGILQRRDFLIMEATGLTHDSKGEKVGYFLMHSVSLRGKIPELSEMGIIRGRMSFCFILRQSGPSSVEIYCRGFSDPKGDMMERVSVAIAAEALLCVAGVVDYAYIKKLTWLMRHKEPQLTNQRQTRRGSRCDSCNKSFTKFSLIAAAIGSATKGSGAACQICRKVVCHKCSVIKKMTIDVSDTGAVKQHPLRFYLGCLLEAKEQSAWEMALSALDASPESPSTSELAPGTSSHSSASIPRKSMLRRSARSYTEYQRRSSRVSQRGEMVADITRSDHPDINVPVNYPKCNNSRINGRFQSSPGFRAAQELVGHEKKYWAYSPPANNSTASRIRRSERSNSTRDVRSRTFS